MKSSNTADPQGFSNSFLKRLKFALAKPLSALYTHIFTSGKIPSDWRLANVTLVFKKGISSNVANYRPISQTSTVSKIFERTVKQQMLAYLIKICLFRANSLASCQSVQLVPNYLIVWMTGRFQFETVTVLMSFILILRRHLIRLATPSLFISYKRMVFADAYCVFYQTFCAIVRSKWSYPMVLLRFARLLVVYRRVVSLGQFSFLFT